MARTRQILCPVDFYENSQRAAEYAVQLARRMKARILFLHVVTPFLPYPYEIQVDTSAILEAFRTRAGEEMSRLVSAAKQQGVRATALVETGEIEVRIRRHARDADLIVMGTRGRRGFEKFLLGSTTERMLRKLQAPLLTIGNASSKSASRPWRHILLATDFEAGTQDAVAFALDFGRTLGAERLTLLHVLNDIDADISGRYRAPLIRTIRRELQELAPKDTAGMKITEHVECGKPWHRILPLVKRDNVDLIVLNIHEKTRLERLVSGSTAERLVRAADVPVLLVPASRKAAARGKKAA